MNTLLVLLFCMCWSSVDPSNFGKLWYAVDHREQAVALASYILRSRYPSVKFYFNCSSSRTSDVVVFTTKNSSWGSRFVVCLNKFTLFQFASQFRNDNYHENNYNNYSNGNSYNNNSNNNNNNNNNYQSGGYSRNQESYSNMNGLFGYYIFWYTLCRTQTQQLEPSKT